MTGLTLELRRGLGRWLVLPLSLFGALYAYQIVPSGPPVWPVMDTALATSVVLTGPLAAGFAALAGTRSHRRHTEAMEQLAARGPAAAGISELIALILWVLVAFTAVLCSLYLPAALNATWSGPDALRMVTAALGLVLCVVVGFIAGRVIPSRLTPAVVAIVIYALDQQLTSSSSTYQWALFLPINAGFSDEFSRLNRSTFAGQLLWYVGIALLLTAGWAIRRTAWNPAKLALVAAGLALSTTGVVVLIPQHGHYLRAGDYAIWTCRGSSPQICLHPALVTAFPAVVPALMPVVDRLTGTPFAIHRAEQRPRGVGSIPTSGAVGFALDDTRPGSIALAGQELSINALGDQDTCFAVDATSTGYELAQLVGAWAAGDASLYTPTSPASSAARSWFLRLNDTARRGWLTRHEKEIRSCTLRYSAFR